MVLVVVAFPKVFKILLQKNITTQEVKWVTGKTTCWSTSVTAAKWRRVGGEGGGAELDLVV